MIFFHLISQYYQLVFESTIIIVYHVWLKNLWNINSKKYSREHVYILCLLLNKQFIKWIKLRISMLNKKKVDDVTSCRKLVFCNKVVLLKFSEFLLCDSRNSFILFALRVSCIIECRMFICIKMCLFIGDLSFDLIWSNSDLCLYNQIQYSRLKQMSDDQYRHHYHYNKNIHLIAKKLVAHFTKMYIKCTYGNSTDCTHYKCQLFASKKL